MLHLLLAQAVILLVIPCINSVIFQDMIYEGLNASARMLEWIENRWEIKKYPNFLRSVAMPITSWQVSSISVT
jgi:hypothetical protein